MATLPRAGAAQPAGRRDGHLLRPGQYLLVGPILATLTVRVRLHRPMHDPLASHLSLLTGGTQLGPSPPAWSAPAASAETSSGASANGAPDRTCHLRLGHLHDVIEILDLAQPRAPPQLAVLFHLLDGARVSRVLVHCDGARVHRVWLPQSLAEEALRGRRVPFGREQEINRLAAAVDRPVPVQ